MGHAKRSKLGARFSDALLLAARLHTHQLRKGTDIPYIAHLLSVAALVIEDGGDEDQAIAALLHDAVEDQGGKATLMHIQLRFGDRVAGMVADLSDSFDTPKPSWRARKEAYLAHLEKASPEVVRISLADKLHNARTILSDVQKCGDRIWTRFNGEKQGTLWYYRALVDVYRSFEPSWMFQEFEKLVVQIENWAERNRL